MNRKELKEAYKERKFKMGVYQIRNTVNGKIFVDGSTNLESIWKRYRFELSMGGHKNAALQQDWKTFGEENFVFEVLSEIAEQEDQTPDYNKEVKLLKEMYLEELQPFEERGYNKKSKN